MKTESVITILDLVMNNMYIKNRFIWYEDVKQSENVTDGNPGEK